MAIHSGGQGWEYWYKTIDDVIQNKAGGYTGSSGDQADLDFSVVAQLSSRHGRMVLSQSLLPGH